MVISGTAVDNLELTVSSDITLALLSQLKLHFCFEFCTMFEIELCVRLEKPNTAVRVCFLSERQEKLR